MCLDEDIIFVLLFWLAVIFVLTGLVSLGLIYLGACVFNAVRRLRGGVTLK